MRRVVLDPDRQIQDTVRLLFDTFRETGSACAVVRRMRGQQILFPRRIRRGIGKGDVLWSAIDHSRVLQILHNPRYAGAFVYGRNRNAYNAKLKPVQRRVPKSDWQVLIPDAHEGYISWAEFERNQATLEHNASGFVAGPARSHAAPGQRVAAGARAVRSLRRAHARALRAAGRSAAPVLPLQRGGRAPRRQALPVGRAARRWTRRSSALLLQTVAPAAIEVALAVQQEIAQRVEQAAALREAQLQRARYEAELARRRYLKVDPENRLVADALEADWNAKLRQLDALQREHERQHAADRTLLDEAARERIMALASDFPRVWNDERTSAVERKRMLGAAHRGRDAARRRTDRHPCALARRAHAEPVGAAAAADVGDPQDAAAGRRTDRRAARDVDGSADRRSGSTSSAIATGAASPSR